MQGSSAEQDAIRKRLRRIEGQIRGLQRMVDEDAYCIDVLTQIAAATRALQGVALELIDAHLQHCVRDAIDAGGPGAQAKIREASDAIARLVKS
jgi:DNA-binding FrmR family transcriptional regulator